MSKSSCILQKSALTTICVAIALAVLRPTSAQAASLVTNGDFNDGLNGWTSTGTLSAVIDTNLQLTNFASLNSTNILSQGIFSQNLTTVSGQNYQVNFDLLNLVSIGNFDVFINSSKKLNITTFVNILGSQNYNFNFVGTGSDTLAFKLDRSLSAYQLDNVTVNATSVPEPFTVVGTMIGGMAALRLKKKLKSTK